MPAAIALNAPDLSKEAPCHNMQPEEWEVSQLTGSQSHQLKLVTLAGFHRFSVTVGWKWLGYGGMVVGGGQN